MFRVLLIGMAALMIRVISPAQETSAMPVRLAHDSLDSTRYELVISDINFDHWYLTNFDQAKDHPDEYYRIKNTGAVQAWNDLYRKGQHSEVIDSWIDYRSDVDYGIELNRKLFWYFKYITTRYEIRLLQ
jgi:hypothetical protein